MENRRYHGDGLPRPDQKRLSALEFEEKLASASSGQSARPPLSGPLPDFSGGHDPPSRPSGTMLFLAQPLM